MRIATYNLWNTSFAWDARLDAIVEVLTALNADVLAIQEAPTWVSATRTFVDGMEAAVPGSFGRLPAWASNPYTSPSRGTSARFTHLARW